MRRRRGRVAGRSQAHVRFEVRDPARDRAAFQAGCGDRRFASNGATSGGECGVLDRHPFETFEERGRPGDEHASVRRGKRHHRNSCRLDVRKPRTITADRRPACATEGKHGGTVVGEARPRLPRSHRYAETGEPGGPGPKQTGGSHRGGKHPARRTNERVGAEFISPRAQRRAETPGSRARASLVRRRSGRGTPPAAPRARLSPLRPASSSVRPNDRR